MKKNNPFIHWKMEQNGNGKFFLDVYCTHHCFRFVCYFMQTPNDVATKVRRHASQDKPSLCSCTGECWENSWFMIYLSCTFMSLCGVWIWF